MRNYEVVYIFDSTLEEPEINAKLERYHALVTGEGDGAGKIDEVDHWGRQPLAYPIADRDNGYYVVVHLSTTAEQLPEFERALQLDDAVLRYLVVVNEGYLTTSPIPIVEAQDDDDSDDREG